MFSNAWIVAGLSIFSEKTEQNRAEIIFGDNQTGKFLSVLIGVECSQNYIVDEVYLLANFSRM